MEKTKGITINWMARIYDPLTNLLGLGKNFMKLVSESIKFKENDRILDAGCGTGTLLIEIRKKIGKKCELIGIDPSEKLIKVARNKSKNLNIKFKEGLIENIKFKNNYFDTVLSTLVFHHLPTELKKKGLKEIKRVLKPKGRLLIVDVGKPENLYSRLVAFFLKWYECFDSNLRGELINLLKETGFKDVKIIKNKLRIMGMINFISAKK